MSSWQVIRRGLTGTRAPGRLSLDLTEEAIVLFEKNENGFHESIGLARLDSPAFNSEIDALRIEALIRDPSKSPVTIWLPEAQILDRSYQLSSQNRGAATAEALRNLQSETGYGAEELAIDLIPGQPGQPSIVLAALCQTVREAIEYTQRWGFTPGPVSTRVRAQAFSARKPVFVLPTTRAAIAGKRLAQVAAVSAIALGCGFAGLKLLEASQPVLHAITFKSVPGHLAKYAENRDQGVVIGKSPRSAVRATHLQSLPIRRFGVSDHERLKLAGVVRYGQVPQSYKTKQLDVPVQQLSMRIGAESSRPNRFRPGRLPPLTQYIASIRIAAVRGAVDQIRIGSRALAQAVRPVRAKRVAVQASVVGLTDQATSEAALLLASVSETPQPRERAAARAIKDARPAGAATLLPPQNATAPDETPAETDAPEPENVSVPLPRPAESTQEAPKSAEPTPTQKAEAPLAPVAPVAPVDLTEAPLAPADVTETASPTGPSLVPQTEPVPDPEEAYAALTSPRPLRRPETLRAVEAKLPKKLKSKPISARASPTSVRVAALERGLELSETNLIGVIEASSGRRGLVRLPGGDFRKVSRGDELNGWRVSSIGRESMRLTRKGQNRTLLLVSR